MVNLDKWEEVEYGKIKRNDTIRCITVQGTVVNDTRGVVDSYDCTGIRNERGIRFVADPSTFKPVEGGHRTIYRLRKQFEFPTKPLSVIEGEGRFTSGPPRRYILLENGGWRSAADGGVAFKDALAANFKNWKIICEGIDS